MMERWDRLLKVRSDITRALETARREKVIGHSLEAEVMLRAEGETGEFITREWKTLKDISIISEMSVFTAAAEGDVVYESEEFPGFTVAVRPARGEKCERCWIRSEEVGENLDHPQLCARCSRVIKELGL